MKNINVYGISILLLTGVLSGCNRQQAVAPSPQAVVVVPAVNEEIMRSYEVVGQTVAQDKVNCLARVTGFLEKREFIEGDFVKKNKLLFAIQKDEYQAKVQSARANLESAQADLINAQIVYNRQKTLLAKKATSQRAYDNAHAAKMMADAKVMAAQGKLKIAKINLSYTDIAAPFDGLIGLAKYSVGNVIGPNSGTLATIVKLDPMKVEFNINEAVILTALQRGNINRSKDDDKINVKLWLSNNTIYKYKGIIDFIDNKINPATGSIKLRAAFKNPNHILLPGQYVKVILENKKKINALLVPQASIQEDQQGKFVMTVINQQVKRKNVTVGEVHGINITIKSGLKAGELVIVEGLQKVRQGMKVKVVQSKLNSDMNSSLDITSSAATSNIKATGK